MYFLLVLWFFSSLSLASETTEITEEALFKLNNNELLTQARELANSTETSFYANVRALDTNQILLNQFNDIPLNLDMDLQDIETLQQADTAVENFKQHLKSLQERQKLSQQKLQQLNESSQQIKVLLKNIEQLEGYALEIQLRQDDKTLLENAETLKQFDLQYLITLQESYTQQGKTWQGDLKQAQQQEMALTNALETTKQQLKKLEQHIENLNKIVEQQQQQQALEKSFLQQNDTEIFSQFQTYQNELEWLEGSFYLAKQSFERYQQKLTELKKAPLVKKLEPEKETNEEAAIEAQLENYQTELKQIKKLEQSLTDLGNQALVLKKESQQLSSYLLKTQVLIKVLKQREIPENSVVQLQKIEQLGTTLEQENQNIIQAISEVESEKQDLYQQTQKINQLQQQTKQQLVQLKRTQKKVIAEKDWQQQVNKFNNPVLIKNIQQKTADLKAKQQKVDQLKQAWQQAQTKTQNLNTTFHELKSPLYRIFEHNEVELKHQLTVEYYALAELEYSLLKKADLSVNPLNSDDLKRWESEDLAATKKQLQKYTEFFAGRINVESEKEQLKPQLLNALNEEQKQLQAYLKLIEQEQQLNFQIETLMGEAKKRIARKKLDLQEMPLETLQKIVQLNIKSSSLIQRQQWLTETKKTLQTIVINAKQYQNILHLSSKKSNALVLIDKLGVEQKLTIDDLSTTEKKNLAQKALRALQRKNSFLDGVLSYFIYEKAEALTELLLEFHQQAIDLSAKKEITQQQNQLYSEVLQLSSQEKDFIKSLSKTLKENLGVLEHEFAKQEALIQLQLKPEQQDAILKRLEIETGQIISLPETLELTDVKGFLDEKIEYLYALKVQQFTLKEWLNLLNNRVSEHGVANEVSVYQHQVGKLEAHSTGQQRQLDDLDQQISTLHKESRQLRQQIAFLAIGKLVFILGFAIAAVSLIERFLWTRLEKKAQRQIPALVRNMTAFVIYLLAFFMIVAFVFGQTLTGILATSGMFAMIIGFAIQMNISNVFSGLAINLERPFEIGDVIEVDGYKGTVLDMTWRTTGIESPNSEKLYIPNHLIAGSVIKNYHAPSAAVWFNAKIRIPIEYNPKEVEALFLDCVKTVAPDCNPSVMFKGIDEWSANYLISYQIADYAQRGAYSGKIWHEIWRRFDEQGIPFAVRK